MAISKKLHALLYHEDGQGLSEYGIVLGIISIAVIVLIASYKDEIILIFQERITDLQSRH